MKGFLLGVAMAGTMPAWASPSTPLPPPSDQQLARDMLKGLVEIDTTHQHGSTAAAKVIQGWLLSAGFPADDVVFIAPPEHPTKGNVVVRYRGKHSRDAALRGPAVGAPASRGPADGGPVLFLGHLDVVEAKPEDWSVDPFKLTQQDGWFYGRGTIDMKDGDAGLAESLIRLKREKFVPERDVIVAFTADEEAGGDSNGPAFLLKEHRDLIDAAFVVNIDGGGGNSKNGERQFFEVGTSEKTYVTFTLETTSPGGHGSLPGPDNAIYKLAAGLGRLESFKFPVTLTETTRTSFDKLAALESGATAADMHAVAHSPPDLAAAERLSQNVRLNAQLRTTCVATLISGGHAENALPQRAKATIQCRMLPGDSAANLQTLLLSTLNDPAIRVTLDAPPIVSPESPPTPQIMKKVALLAQSMWPNVQIIPTMATGFSDDRQTRNAGMASYDISGVWQDVDENRAHGRDERIGVQAFDESVEFTYRLIKEMSKSK